MSRTISLGCSLIVVMAVVGPGCSTQPDGGSPPATTASATTTYPQLVDVGDHSLYLTCEGQGDPTVVFESGLGDFSSQWTASPIMDAVSSSTRACAYDRAGVGASDARSTGEPVSARAVADDLHALLVAGHIDPPYVLVGHSIGGVFVRMFASSYADEVAGMVLLDPATEFQFQGRFWRWEQKAEGRQTQTLPDGATTLDLPATVDDMASATSIDVPLVVLTAGVDPDPAWVDRAWMGYHERIAAMSPDSIHGVVRRADHYIHAAEPDVVITAVSEVVRAARDGSPLPACGRMFAPSDVICALR
jgi:pimeloyl-ACP methyl ester carboxylesterase